jgi:outer membrane protein assembly factor BamB
LQTSRWLRRGLTAAALIILPILLSSCVGGPVDPVWGSLSLYGDPQHILFAFNDRIVMLDPVDGRPVPLRDNEGNVRLDDQGNPRIWQILTTEGTPAKFFLSPIPLDDDRLLVVSYDRGLFEVDAPTARFENPAGQSLGGQQVVAPPLLDGETLYIPFNGNNLIARQGTDFNQIWELRTSQGMWSQPLLIDGILYATSLDHNLYALNPETGDVLWQLDMGGAVTAQPVFLDGYLYVGTFGRQFHQVEIGQTGRIIASYPTRDWVWSEPAVQDGVFYFGDVGGNLYSLRNGDGSFEEVMPPVKVANGSIVATPLLTEDAIVVGSRDNFTTWVGRSTGEIIAQRQMAGSVLANMLLIEPSEQNELSRPIVVVSTMNHTEFVVAFAADTGERIWAYTR